jgi:predicted kinase
MERRQQQRPSTRTNAILDAVRHQVEQRRALLDNASDLGSVQITVRLDAGTAQVRSVTVAEERIVRRM